jgi:hypothetical protein
VQHSLSVGIRGQLVADAVRGGGPEQAGGRVRGGGGAAAAAAAAGGAGGVCPDEFFRVNAYVLCLSFENMRAIRGEISGAEPANNNTRRMTRQEI